MTTVTKQPDDAATGCPKPAAGNVTDKRGYAERWQFSLRHVDNLIAKGLPHLKIGARRVRILTDEADSWMRATFGTQRTGRVNGEQQ
jgi:hypothetical protein